MDWLEHIPDLSEHDLNTFDYDEGKSILIQKLNDDEVCHEQYEVAQKTASHC